MFFFQAEDGIRDLVRSRGLGDVYKRQEAAPFAKTGGLADVVGALPLALDALGHRVTTVLPLSLIHI